MSTITLSHDLQNGTTADADEVMENFNDIINECNGSLDGDNISSSAALSIASLTTSGNGTIGGTLAVTGAQTFTGNTTLSGTLIVTGAQTYTGASTFNGGIIGTPETYTPAASATATLNLALGNEHRITMPAGNITIAISNETDGQKFIIDIKQDSVGSRTVTWFAGISWADGSAPTLTTTALKTDTFGFKVQGTDLYFGYVVGQNI